MTDTTLPMPQLPPLRRNSGFRNFWLSRAVSGLGSAVTTVALPVLVFQQSRSPLLVSLVAAAGTLPYLAFGLLAGAVADRVDRRTLMIVTDCLSALCLGSLPLAQALHALTVGHVVVVAFVSSTLSLFFDAGGYGFVPALVGKDRLPDANSALYGAETVVRIIGNGVAGVLIALVHPVGTLTLDAVSFAGSALFLRAVANGPSRVVSSGPRTSFLRAVANALSRAASSGRRTAFRRTAANAPAHATTNTPAPSSVPRPGFRESVREGLRFLAGHPTLRVMTVVGTLQSFSGGAIVGQLVVFADRVLGIHGSDGRIGLLYMAWSAGGIGGSLLLPRLRRRYDAFPLLQLVLPVGALLGLVVVLSADWRIALVALAAWGTAYLVVLVNTMTYSQEVTPAELQGRVNTTRRMLSSGLGVPLGALAASAVTLSAGIRAGMATAVASITLAAIVVWVVRLRGLPGTAGGA
ncbi:MFS transporter [Streptomyces hokutonensis]|uniref:MFS transporter n=1 Tax=Streptomyces hokutonensis TaxID=1306990 RepID=UPI00035CAC06|nr:MFS transporter [Streptomyces hokutonensis]